MIDLAISTQPNGEHVVDLPYRLSSWALDDPSNVGLWADRGGDLIAWAVMQLPFWTIDIAIRQDAEEVMFPHALTWATNRATRSEGETSKRPSWYIHVFSDRVSRIRAIEQAGYECQADVGEDSWSQVLLQRHETAPTRPASADGFDIRSLDGISEISEYVDLHRAAFESKNMTEEWRLRTLEAPHYRRSTDLVAISEEGEFAGFCIGWLLPGESPIGQIEPLGVRAAFRGQGLGTALLTECLARLSALGAQEIVVETDSFRDPALKLYTSVGFAPTRDILIYRKDFSSNHSR